MSKVSVNWAKYFSDTVSWSALCGKHAEDLTLHESQVRVDGRADKEQDLANGNQVLSFASCVLLLYSWLKL